MRPLPETPPHRTGSAVRAALILFAWLVPAFGLATPIKGPFVVLEGVNALSIRMEVDRPDYEFVFLHGDRKRSPATPVYSRSPRDTFLAEVEVDLKKYRRFSGYEVRRAGESVGRYDWRSRIDGTLDGYPRLIMFGDSQGGPEILSRLARQWLADHFDILVALGDLVDFGTEYEAWEKEFFGPLRHLLPHYPLLVVCGNHEPYRGKTLYWFDWFLHRGDGRRYFRMDFADLRLVGINNSDVHTKYGFDPVDPLTPQYEFLLQSLLGTDASRKKALVLSHVPIFSGSTVVNDEYGSELQRRYVLPILERSRVLAFFSGHHHKYERLSHPGFRADTQFIVTGGAGGGLFPAGTGGGPFVMDREIYEVFHYLTVDLDGTGTVIARTVEGDE
ncbi:MAG: metallophosphoesterase family protein, partial [Opitutaceae bacterium]